ncbi:MAG: hypothetical protein Fur0022_15590 [Anaerolineales bacterium]
MDEATILSFIQHAVKTDQVKISLHAAEEALAEEITRSEIEEVLLSAQILEDYSDWWLGARCLLYGKTKQRRDIHIVSSYHSLPITIVTVYIPQPPKWKTPIERGGR